MNVATPGAALLEGHCSGRFDNFARRAMLPAVNKERFLQKARSQCAERDEVGPNFFRTGDWIVEFLGESQFCTAVVSANCREISPYGRKIESWLQILLDCGKRIKSNAGCFEYHFHYNHCDLAMPYQEVVSKMLNEDVPPPSCRGWHDKEGTLQCGDDNFARLKISGSFAIRKRGEDQQPEIDQRQLELHVEACSLSGQGLLGVLKAVLRKLRPCYKDVQHTAWKAVDLINFLRDYNGRLGWCSMYDFQRFQDGFSLAIPSGRPYWLAAPRIDDVQSEPIKWGSFGLRYQDRLTKV